MIAFAPLSAANDTAPLHSATDAAGAYWKGMAALRAGDLAAAATALMRAALGAPGAARDMARVALAERFGCTVA